MEYICVYVLFIDQTVFYSICLIVCNILLQLVTQSSFRGDNIPTVIFLSANMRSFTDLMIF